MGSLRRALVNVRRIVNSTSIATAKRSRNISGSCVHPETFIFRLSHQNQSFSYLNLSRFSSTDCNSHSLDIDLSNDESKRRLFNRLLYRSKQRGFLELDLVLGKWVEDHIHSLDAGGIKALVQVLDLENPDLWKWVTGQEQPPETVKTNPVFTAVQDKVMKNLNKHASPHTRASPGKPWVRGWDDFKKGRDSPISGNQ